MPPVTVPWICTVPPEARIAPELLTVEFKSKIPLLLASKVPVFSRFDTVVLSVSPGTLALMRPWLSKV